jgi:hypothetical protein
MVAAIFASHLRHLRHAYGKIADTEEAYVIKIMLAVAGGILIAHYLPQMLRTVRMIVINYLSSSHYRR